MTELEIDSSDTESSESEDEIEEKEVELPTTEVATEDAQNDNDQDDDKMDVDTLADSIERVLDGENDKLLDENPFADAPEPLTSTESGGGLFDDLEPIQEQGSGLFDDLPPLLTKDDGPILKFPTSLPTPTLPTDEDGSVLYFTQQGYNNHSFSPLRVPSVYLFIQKNSHFKPTPPKSSTTTTSTTPNKNTVRGVKKTDAKNITKSTKTLKTSQTKSIPEPRPVREKRTPVKKINIASTPISANNNTKSVSDNLTSKTLKRPSARSRIAVIDAAEVAMQESITSVKQKAEDLKLQKERERREKEKQQKEREQREKEQNERAQIQIRDKIAREKEQKLIREQKLKAQREQQQKEKEQKEQKEEEEQKDENNDDDDESILLPLTEDSSTKPPITTTNITGQKRPLPTELHSSPPLQQHQLQQPARHFPFAHNMPFSDLIQEEHTRFIELEYKWRSDPHFIEGPQAAEFFGLKSRVLAEQERYRRAFENMAKSKKLLYAKFHGQIEAQVEAILNQRRKKTLETHPKYYRLIHTINLSDTIKPVPGDPILTHEATLLEKGTVLNCIPLSPQTDIPPALKIKQDHDSMQEDSSSKEWYKRDVTSILEDEEIEALLQKHDVDVVVGSSTLCTLMDNHAPQFNEQWEIPVTIKTKPGVTTNESGVEGSNNNGSKRLKTIYLEKPLMKKRMTHREKNQIFYQLAFKRMSLDAKRPHRLSYVEGNVMDKDNLVYNTWRLGDTRILVRCKIHGYIEPPFKRVGLKTKLEYLCNLVGYESTIINETARWWMYTFLRGDADLILGRINVEESKILRVEKRMMMEILPPGCSFNPKLQTKMIRTIIQCLCEQQDDGKYLIGKNKDGRVYVYKQCNEMEGDDANGVVIGAGKNLGADVYDFYSSYSGAGSIDSASDVTFILPEWEGGSGQISYTFPIKHGPEPMNVRYKNIQHCYGFRDWSVCKNKECKFPHLTKDNLEAMLASGVKSAKRSKTKN